MYYNGLKGGVFILNILFVCTGNTCRSPMAETIFNHLMSEDKKARSAGLFAANGSSAAYNAREVLHENGMQISHSSELLDETHLTWATLVLAMTTGHKILLMERFPGAADKIFTLKEYVNGNNGDLDVLDPYGGDLDVYRATFAELKALIGKISE